MNKMGICYTGTRYIYDFKFWILDLLFKKEEIKEIKGIKGIKGINSCTIIEPSGSIKILSDCVK